MKPPIRYFGGKGNFYNRILREFPEPQSYDTYIEPFGGSYSVGLANTYFPPNEIYNDLERNVYSLYKVISNPTLFQDFKRELDLLYYAADLREEFRESLKCDDLSITERAVKFFYVSRTSFNGIGGTIQNPLLLLNADGSISSRNKSFVINPDGTGHFASGRFTWTENTITLKDVVIRWEDFDEQAKENLLPKSVSLSGTDVFHYPDELDLSQCEPPEIYVFATEYNFVSESRNWQYLASDPAWKNIASDNKDFLIVKPDSHYWEERNVLTIKYTAICEGGEYESIFTISKQFDGQDAYSIYIQSENGTVFKNGIIKTVLTASVFKGGVDVTDIIPDKNFRWKRISTNEGSDDLWNSVGRTGGKYCFNNGCNV